MSILRYQTKMIEGPFRSKDEHYFTMILGDVEDFQTQLVCSSNSCDWEGLPSEAESKTVDTGDFEGWKKLTCPRQSCRRGLKTIPESSNNAEKNET